MLWETLGCSTSRLLLSLPPDLDRIILILTVNWTRRCGDRAPAPGLGCVETRGALSSGRGWHRGSDFWRLWAGFPNFRRVGGSGGLRCPGTAI